MIKRKIDLTVTYYLIQFIVVLFQAFILFLRIKLLLERQFERFSDT